MHAVGAEVLRVLKPLGIDAAVKALEAQTSETSAAQRQLELALQQARYRGGACAPAIRCRRSRQSSGRRRAGAPLERGAAGRAPDRGRDRRDRGEASRRRLGEKERQQLMQLGADLELAWSHPAATAATRKRIVRAALHEIVVRIEGGVIEMVLHWQGGDHTALKLKQRLNAAGKHRWTMPEDTMSLVRELARLMPDRQIARLLNRVGKPTGRGNGWTAGAGLLASATTTTLPSTATANGPSAARSRLKRRRKSSM